MAIRSNRNKGFTLIELLVVVSIIGLLSTVILGAIADGRIKAQNSSRNSLIQEYITALSLYRNHYGTYPSGSNPTSESCLGRDSNDTCYGSYSNDEILLGKLEPYMSGLPSDEVAMSLGPLDVSGAVYKCTDAECSDFTINWFLSSQNSNCIGGIDPVASGNLLNCTYNSSVILR